jgi:hypothetical protein
MSEAAPEQITAFITRWQTSGAAERANYQMFLSELCDIIGVPRPDPTSPDPTKNLYVFDRAITRTHLDGTTTTNYIDLYKAGHFVNETKQGLSADATPDELAKPTATKTGHGKRGTLAFDKALERALPPGPRLHHRPACRRGTPAIPDRLRRGPHDRPLRRVHRHRRPIRALPRSRLAPHHPARSPPPGNPGAPPQSLARSPFARSLQVRRPSHPATSPDASPPWPSPSKPMATTRKSSPDSSSAASSPCSPRTSACSRMTASRPCSKK